MIDKHFIALGCSWTADYSYLKIENPELYGEYKDVYATWATHLGKDFKKYSNLACPGQGNGYMYHRLAYYLSTHKNTKDLCVGIMFSDYTRMYFSTDTYVEHPLQKTDTYEPEFLKTDGFKTYDMGRMGSELIEGGEWDIRKNNSWTQGLYESDDPDKRKTFDLLWKEMEDWVGSPDHKFQESIANGLSVSHIYYNWLTDIINIINLLKAHNVDYFYMFATQDYHACKSVTQYTIRSDISGYKRNVNEFNDNTGNFEPYWQPLPYSVEPMINLINTQNYVEFPTRTGCWTSWVVEQDNPDWRDVNHPGKKMQKKTYTEVLKPFLKDRFGYYD